MRFLIDMPLSPGLVIWLAARGHDAVHASAVGLLRAADVEILDHAKRERRTILTADLDYPRLLATTNPESSGLILFRGGNYSDREIEDRLARVFALVPDEEIATSLLVVEKTRIRRRRLPF
ncbi:MAG: hypothetical protein H6Q86_3599 [candidate division NC10 bacterium]|nr:hypothetical protein [candidate division NC10 bacterium]